MSWNGTEMASKSSISKEISTNENNNATLIVEMFSNFTFDFVIVFLASKAFLAPLLLIFVEEAGLPLSVSDFVIAYTGYQVAAGRISFLIAYIIILLTDLIGASLLFFLCRKYGKRSVIKLGKYIDLDPEKLQVVENYFKKFGPLFIIFGRHIIGLRVPITIFSGISRMNYWVFIGSTVTSIAFGVYFYLSLGMQLGPKVISVLHSKGFDALIILLPIIGAFLPFFFLRKKHVQKQ